MLRFSGEDILCPYLVEFIDTRPSFMLRHNITSSTVSGPFSLKTATVLKTGLKPQKLTHTITQKYYINMGIYQKLYKNFIFMDMIKFDREMFPGIVAEFQPP